MKRHREALIIDGGACNPLPIARAFNDAVREAAETAHGSDEILRDPAVLLILNQLCHLAGLGSPVPYNIYEQAREACERQEEV